MVLGQLPRGAALAAFYYHWWVITLAAFAFAVLVSLLAPVAFDQHVEQQLRRSASDPTVRGSFGEHRLTLSDEGLREVTPAIESLAKWQSVTDVVVDNGHIYVRLASGQAAVINRLSYSGAIAFEQIPQVIHEYRQKHAFSYSPVSRIETALILTNSRMP